MTVSASTVNGWAVRPPRALVTAAPAARPRSAPPRRRLALFRGHRAAAEALARYRAAPSRGARGGCGRRELQARRPEARVYAVGDQPADRGPRAGRRPRGAGAAVAG